MFDIASIMIYLTTFVITLFFCKISEVSFKKNNYLVGRVCATFVMVIPSLLAALRDSSVGGDVEFYLIPNFNEAVKSITFGNFYQTASEQLEYLFSAIVYLCSKYANINVLFFIIQFLVICPVYVALYKNRNSCSMTLGMSVYLFCFYNFSLSGMRQSIAMAFILLGYTLYEEKKYIKTLLIAILSILFHKSATVIIAILIIIKFLEKRNNYKLYIKNIFIFLVLFFIFYDRIAELIARILWKLSPRYSFYIRFYLKNYINWSDIPGSEMLIKTLPIIICIVFLIASKKLNVDGKIYTLMILVILGRYFVLFNARFYESLRIAYYFDMFGILFIASSVRCVKQNSVNRLIYSLIMMSCVFTYWIYFIMYIGGYSTNVYMFG